MLKCLARNLSEGDEVGQLAVKPLIHAKYPIIRIQHLQEKSIKVDISIADRFCSKRCVSMMLSQVTIKLYLHVQMMTFLIMPLEVNQNEKLLCIRDKYDNFA